MRQLILAILILFSLPARAHDDCGDIVLPIRITALHFDDLSPLAGLMAAERTPLDNVHKYLELGLKPEGLPIYVRAIRSGEQLVGQIGLVFADPAASKIVPRERGKWAYLSLTLFPEYRGLGLGPRAVKMVIARARALGFDHLIAETRRNDYASFGTLLTSGFEHTRYNGDNDILELALEQK